MNPAKRATILVVDDNPATLYATSRVIRGAGFDVLEAKTGLDALKLAETGPDLVILDVNLPDISGFEVCRRLRQLPASDRVPIIHLSATFVTDTDKVLGLELGADGYLTRPVEPPVLIATIHAYLRARNAEEARLQSERSFLSIFEKTPHGIALLDRDLELLEVNPAIARLLGHSRKDLYRRPLQEFAADRPGPEIADLRESIERTGSWNGMFPVANASGQRVDLEWSISPHSEAGTFLAIVTDVTERRRMAMERETLLERETVARAELQRANQVKDDFLATLSHELRTPLNVIVGWSEILRSQISAGHELLEGIEAITRNAKVQQQLISDLLDVSRITSGKLQIEFRPLDIGELTRSAVQSIASDAEAKHQTLECVIDAGLKPVLGDAARLQQVVWNLVNNAIKFTPRGGRIGVHVQTDAKGVRIVVRDTGQGVSPAFLPHIFERFRQESSVITRQHGGLGIGLAIVSHLVELHRGTVEASSPGEGKGATFVVRLPAAAAGQIPAKPKPRTAADQRTGLPLAGVAVLIVDDDRDGRVMLRNLLSQVGASVVDCSSVDDACRELNSFKPDIILSDIAMPAKDGYSLIREVRARGHSNLPAVALTAFARTEDAHRALEAGFQAHLPKPLDFSALLTTILRLVSPER